MNAENCYFPLTTNGIFTYTYPTVTTTETITFRIQITKVANGFLMKDGFNYFVFKNEKELCEHLTKAFKGEL